MNANITAMSSFLIKRSVDRLPDTCKRQHLLWIKNNLRKLNDSETSWLNENEIERATKTEDLPIT